MKYDSSKHSSDLAVSIARKAKARPKKLKEATESFNAYMDMVGPYKAQMRVGEEMGIYKKSKSKK